ncbi:MAG: sulfatase-like hydrolase/transferase [Planctomycetota bacterium]|nr:sulfatase-like hydrolase/transferase [Planctomycetota bacterium]
MQSARLSSTLPLLFGSGLVAILDGILQAVNVGPTILAPIVSFNLIGAWAICLIVAILLVSVLRKSIFHQAAFGMGLAIGAMPLLHSLIPFPFSHISFLALLFIVIFVKPIKNPSLMLCGSSSLVFAVFVMASVLMSHNLPKHPTSAPAAASSHKGSDVILISIDTLRADAIYSKQDIGLTLPALKQLRQRSMWADYALSSSNQTLPGHMGMLSGLSATSHGVRSNRDLPDTNLNLAADYFAEAGFQTSAVISNALLSSATGMHRGFANFNDEAIGLARIAILSKDYLASHSWLSMFLQSSRAKRLFRSFYYRHKYQSESIAEHCTDIALAQLDVAYTNEAPLFQFIHFMDPHTNYAPPTTARGVISAQLANQIDKRYLPSSNSEITVTMVRDVQEQIQGGDSASALAATYYHQVYLEEVIEVDRQLQRIITKLDGSGRPYVLLLTADHGEQFAEHGLMDHANSLYEENLRVPFLLSGHNIEPTHIDGVVQLCDVLPTLLDYAGLDYDVDRFDGMAVRGTIAARPHVAVDQKEIAVRDTAGNKWIGTWQANGDFPVGVKLFNFEHGEGENFLNKDKELPDGLSRLIDYYFERDTHATRQANTKTSEAQQSALNAMGYADQEDDR